MSSHNHCREDDSGLLGDLLDLPVVPAPEHLDWLPDGFRAPMETADVATPGSAELTGDQRRFLESVINNPGLPSSAYTKIARMSPRKARRLRLSLVETDYLRETYLNAAKRGRASIRLEPTLRARNWYQRDKGKRP